MFKSKWSKQVAALAVAFGAFAGSASAAVISHVGSGDGPNAHLYQLFDSIGADSLDTIAEVNAGQLLDDQYWAIAGGAAGSLSTMIFEISGASALTTFGIYDKTDASKKVALWNGAAAPGPGNGGQAVVSFGADGSVIRNFVDSGVDFAGNAFGYYISIVGGPTFYSDEALNGGADQMASFSCATTDFVTIPGYLGGNCVASEYFLAFEDILVTSGGDKDYNDLVVGVESVYRIPEPASLALVGLGLLGVGLARRRRD